MIRVLPSQPRRRGPRGASARGFTLVESLTVVTLIGILAVAASPTFVRLLRDRRVNRAAMHLVDVYRSARTRAMGRGQPILVSWTKVGNQGRAQMIEPVVTDASSASNCGRTNWSNFQPAGTAGGVQEVMKIDLTNPRYELADETFNDDQAAVQTYAEICFTPMGRTYIRATTAAAFRPMAGVASFTVENHDTGLKRTVFIPSSGVARLQL